jgi:hypothetical protein
MMKRAAIGVVGAIGAYFLALLLGGWLGAGCVAERIDSRLEQALGTEVEIGSASVALIRGKIEISDITIRRTDLGQAEFHVESAELDVAPMGGVLFTRSTSAVRIGEASGEMSAIGALGTLRAKTTPIAIGDLTIEHGTLSAAPTALLPGLGKVVVDVRNVIALDVELSHALSWLPKAVQFESSVKVPGGIEIDADYADGKLGLAGSMFGSDKMTVPFRIPVATDGAEIGQMIAVAKALVRSVGKELIDDKIDKLEDEVIDRVKGWLD